MLIVINFKFLPPKHIQQKSEAANAILEGERERNNKKKLQIFQFLHSPNPHWEQFYIKRMNVCMLIHDSKLKLKTLP